MSENWRVQEERGERIEKSGGRRLSCGEISPKNHEQSHARPDEIGLDLRVGGLHSLRNSLKQRRCANRIEVAVVLRPLLVA
jgi:hypothetical protein